MLKELPRGASVFIDSNIFTYHLSGHSKFGRPCKEFLEAVEDNTYTAYINDVVVSEVLLNFVKSELYRVRKIEPYDAVKRIKTDGRLVDGIALDKPVTLVENLGLEIIPIDSKISEVANALKEYRLLPHDSMHLLSMKKAGVKNIATADKDFERVTGIDVWKP